jgi:DNA-binding XRE family transcriptional regulator/DNA-directed RNA polymerase specialized sigma subunit
MNTKGTREMLGISKAKMAEILNISKATVTLVENGSRASIPAKAEKALQLITLRLIEIGFPIPNELQKNHLKTNEQTFNFLEKRASRLVKEISIAKYKHEIEFEKYVHALTEMNGLEILESVPWPETSMQEQMSQALLSEHKSLHSDKSFKKVIKSKVKLDTLEQELRTIRYFQGAFLDELLNHPSP